MQILNKLSVYIAGPLFNEMELERNRQMKVFINSLGFDAYLPQEDAGTYFDLMTTESKNEVRKRLFQLDARAVKECDIILCLFDGRVPDEGTCIELGMAYAWDKLCIGYKTDNRAMDVHGDDNLMIEGCIESRMVGSLPDLRDLLLDLNVKWLNGNFNQSSIGRVAQDQPLS